jgi:hypothetical protein
MNTRIYHQFNLIGSLCNRYTSSTTAIVWVASPASRAPVLQAIEELATKIIEQVLKLLDGNDGF